SAAIASLWAAGYLATGPAAAAMAQSEAAAAMSNATSSPTAAPSPAITPVARGGQAGEGGFRRRGGEGIGERPATPAPTAVPANLTRPSASAAPAAVALKDGTFTGSGMGRRGGVNVSVTIANGKITAASITSLTIHYPHNILNALPPEVVARQTDQVDIISG